MLILGRSEVAHVLTGREHEVVEAVRRAYLAHASGRTVVPHSLFLRFPSDDRNRIIALPAYLDGERPVAGIKWISSFPENTRLGLERASAAILLNSLATGHPEALLEGSTISARRTAASAALAARTLRGPHPETGVSLVGCGVINFEILRFLRASVRQLTQATLFDTDPLRAEAFAERVGAEGLDVEVDVATGLDEALAAHALVSFATTSGSPHAGLDACARGTLVLHVSLRDLTVGAILTAANVVDDADHVCREQTSLHLAEQATGHRRFVHATIGDLLLAGKRGRDPERVTVFSPFGLGALDLAVADLVRRQAEKDGLGTRVDGFLSREPAPEPAR